MKKIILIMVMLMVFSFPAHAALTDRVQLLREKNAALTARNNGVVLSVNYFRNSSTRKERAATLKGMKLSNKNIRLSNSSVKKCLKFDRRGIPSKAYQEFKKAQRSYGDAVRASRAARAHAKESRKIFKHTQRRSLSWNGSILTRSGGVNYGPSGKETYYNLPMGGVIYYMRQRGYKEKDFPYWVRDDGCKMFGDYIMCAANLSEHPYGSLVECSLGTCIVCDTGGFASSNRYQLDIAVTW